MSYHLLDQERIEAARLRALEIYRPSRETLARRAALPPPSALPQLSVAELAARGGGANSGEEAAIFACVCGYVFNHRSFFKAHHGRDITFRVSLHRRNVNMDANDTDPHGRDPSTGRFPTLAALEPTQLEYARQWRDRFHALSGPPVAVLREFWEEQEQEQEELGGGGGGEGGVK